MTPEQLGQLQQQLHALQVENEQLRQQLSLLAQQQQTQAQVRSTVVRGGGRLLIPLLDRHKVVRSFGKLAETAGNFTGPREQWPSRDDVLGDAQRFLESMVRFAVRRRTLLMLLALLGTLIPAIQIWLVVQQNDIIRNQNVIVDEQKKLSEIHVFDVVSRSMTEGDRNAKLMTGALLSRADPQFLGRVIDDAFNPALAVSFGDSSYNATARRLEDAAFRGHLVRAAVWGIHRRASTEEIAPLAEQSLPMLRRILQDAALRVLEVLRQGKGNRTEEDAAGLDEEVEGYLLRVGEAIQLYSRLARATGHTEEFVEDLRPLLRRVDWDGLSSNRFRRASQLLLEQVLLDLAMEPKPGDPFSVDTGDLTREAARTTGLDALRQMLGEEGVDWARLAQEAAGS